MGGCGPMEHLILRSALVLLTSQTRTPLSMDFVTQSTEIPMTAARKSYRIVFSVFSLGASRTRENNIRDYHFLTFRLPPFPLLCGSQRFGTFHDAFQEIADRMTFR